MIMLGDSTAVVTTQAELISAIGEENEIDYVYLGENIVMSQEIRIDVSKTILIIDGEYPSGSGDIHSLTDGGYDGRQITVYQSPSLDLTFQNMVITGRNYYGMPRVYDYANAVNVTVTYRNVVYTGPQITWHVRGLARYIDCDITIMNAGFSPMNEVAEINRVEIGGNTRIQHNNSGVFAVFYFYYANPYLTILEDAVVEISTLYDFLYNQGTYYVPFTIQPRASLTLITQRGISRGSGHRAASVLVDENASFRYIRNSSAGDAYTFYVNGDFTVNQGASVYMQADFTGVSSLIRFASNSASLNLNDPKSFVLYNNATAASAAVMSFYTTTPIELSGGQLNFWTVPQALPTAGNLDDIPYRKWNRPNWSTFTLQGTAGSSQTIISDNDFTEEELELVPPLSEFQLNTAKVLSVGKIVLEPDVVIVGHPVTGTTDPYANVEAEYSEGGMSYFSSDVADEEGSFVIVPTPPVPLADTVKISANTPFLIVFILETAREDGELGIKEAPETIEFGIRPMSEFPDDLILPRSIPDAPVVISDMRAVKTDWELRARITGPLTTAENDILHDAVVFVIQDGSMITLSTEPQTVHIGEPFTEEEKDIEWDPEKGVLAKITGPVRSDKAYTTQIEWEVLPL